MENGNGTTAAIDPNVTSTHKGSASAIGMSEKQSNTHEEPSNDHTQDRYVYVLAAIVVLGFFVLTALLMIPVTKVNVDAGNKEILLMLFGGLVTGFSMVLSYFFGSSAGSAQKTVALAKIAKKG